MRTVYQREAARELCASSGEIDDFGSITGARPQRHLPTLTPRPTPYADRLPRRTTKYD